MTENNTQSENNRIQSKSFICPNCGGGLRHDPKKDKFLCSSCGYEGEIQAVGKSIQEYSFDDYKIRENQSVPFEDFSVADCQSCGCEVTFGQRQTATVCPMCGSAQVSILRQRAGIPPEGIIPFRVDRQEAAEKFREWLKGLWFAPSKLKKSVQEGRFVGKFVPFWTYDAEVTAPYVGQGGRYKKVKDEEGQEQTEIDWYPTAGIVSSSFNDLIVCAVQGEGAEGAEQAAPFDTVNHLKPFANEYLAGYSAEVYTIKADAAFEDAKEQMESTMKDMAESEICTRFDTYRAVKVTARYTSVTYKHVLLPVWMSLFSYGGKTYRYIVNGETGKVDGKRPYSIPKVLAAILAALAIMIGVFLFFSQESNAAGNLPESAETANVSRIEREEADYGLVWTGQRYH